MSKKQKNKTASHSATFVLIPYCEEHWKKKSKKMQQAIIAGEIVKKYYE